MRRWPALVIIVALIAAGVVEDQRGVEDVGADAASPVALEATGTQRSLPTAGPRNSPASTWYCAGGTATEDPDDGVADHVVVITNPGPEAVSGTVTAVGDEGEGPATETIEVDPHSRTSVRLGDVITASWAAATVEADGRVVVDHEVGGDLGTDAAPCASAGSRRWYFAAGTTTRDADMRLVLYNPFPEPAAVDLAFQTREGRRLPSDFQGVQVPPFSVVTARVTDQVTVRDQLATEIRTRSGRLVVDRLQTFNGEGAATTEEEVEAQSYTPEGMTLHLGVPERSTAWVLPYGYKSENAHERYVVFNPDPDETALVDLAVTFTNPRRNGEIDPIGLDLPPRSFQVVDFDAETRIPEGVGHTAVARSLNGVGVVVERRLDTTPGAASVGVASSTGVPAVAPVWVVAAGEAKVDEEGERLAITNPTDGPVTLSVGALTGGDEPEPAEGARAITVPALTHRVVDLTDRLPEAGVSLVVRADGPVAVERLRSDLSNLGNSIAPTIPLPDGLIPAAETAIAGA